MKRQRGLTILEALVILVIVAAVAAILFPLLLPHSHRTGAKRTQCLFNVKQQATAVLLYADDHNGCFPLAESWMRAVSKRLVSPEVLHCPSVVVNQPKGRGYAYSDLQSGKMVDSVRAPAEEVMLFESIKLYENAHDPVTSRPKPGRHEGLNVTAFLDGHAKGVRAQ